MRPNAEDPLIAVVPTSIHSRLPLDDHVRLLVWDGELAALPAEAAEAAVWVPPYGVGTGRDWISERLSALPSVRVVQLLSAGVEPWPDALPAGVTLCGGRGIHGGSTAELAVALLLSLVRELPRYGVQQAGRHWQRHAPDTVAGRHVLVLGAGDIGRRVAEVLQVLEAEVTLVGRTERDDVVGLDRARRLVPHTDAVVVALPHTPETHGVVDRALLAALPDRAVVVNVARGALVDLEALTDEVESGRLRAGLDVTDPEPLPADHRLWGLPGVVITPHVGGGAAGWQQRAAEVVVDQLARIRAGEPPRHQVRAGY